MNLNILTLLSLRDRDYVFSPWIWVSFYLFWAIEFVVNKSHSSFFWHLGCLVFYWQRYLSCKKFNYPDNHDGKDTCKWMVLTKTNLLSHTCDAILDLLGQSICQVNTSEWPQLTLQGTEELPTEPCPNS